MYYVLYTMFLQPQSGDISVEESVYKDLAPERYNYNVNKEKPGAKETWSVYIIKQREEEQTN